MHTEGISYRLSSQLIDVDRQGNKWFAGRGYGIWKFDGINFFSYNTVNKGSPYDQINALFINSMGIKWFGVQSGVLKLEDTTCTAYSTSKLVNDYVYEKTEDANGYKWFATLGGVSRFDVTNWIKYTNSNSGLVNNNVISMAIDKKGYKWMGTLNSGISEFQK
ncbi:MAG: hypothetical protein WCI92_02720 [Bacteroidota bacterium]